MKKLFTLLVLLALVAGGFAQQAKKEIQVDSRLYSVLTAQQIEDLRANNPVQLVTENCNLVSYCFLAMKFSEEEGTYKMKGELRNFVKPGKSCNYQDIIATGCINRYDYNLEQDPYRQNVYSLGNTGAYIVVLSKVNFDNVLNGWLREYGLYGLK